MKIVTKNTFCKVSMLIIFCILFNGALKDTIPEDFCDMEDEAMTKWYTDVFQFVKTNENATQNIAELKENLRILEAKVEKTHTKLANLEMAVQQTHKKLDKILQLQQTNREIVIQRREDGSVDFYRNWVDYKRGFGDPSGEFFIGLDKLNRLTNRRPYGLLIVMEDWDNERRYASYSQFVVGSESENYKLKSLGNYTGSAGDSLSLHLGQKFSTKDEDNDESSLHCAVLYRGAWWYSNCMASNLNGRYLKGTVRMSKVGEGINWHEFRGIGYSLKFVEMSLVPSIL